MSGPGQKLTADLQPGEFFKMDGSVFLVLEVSPSRKQDKVMAFLADADNPATVQVVRLPWAWVTLADRELTQEHRELLQPPGL